MASTTIYTCDICNDETAQTDLRQVKIDHGSDPSLWSEVCPHCRAAAKAFLLARRPRASGRIDV